jgi:hypothetical protein
MTSLVVVLCTLCYWRPGSDSTSTRCSTAQPCLALQVDDVCLLMRLICDIRVVAHPAFGCGRMATKSIAEIERGRFTNRLEEPPRQLMRHIL